MARKLWINLSDTFAMHHSVSDPIFHFTACLGLGHVVPFDDFALPRNGGLPLESFNLYDPQMRVTPLRLPTMDTFTTIDAPGVYVESGDMAAHKVVFGKDSLPGTYQLGVQTPEFYITQYKDEKGHTVWDPRPMSDFAPGTPIDSSIKVRINAKVTATYKEWSRPEPLGYEFEIIPVTPLDQILPNQPVTFEIRHMGKPFTCTMHEMQFLLASSNTYGGEAGGSVQGFFLSAYALDGQARFCFPTAGQWLVTAFSNAVVEPGGPWDAYKDRCKRVFHTASMTVNVRAV